MHNAATGRCATKPAGLDGPLGFLGPMSAITWHGSVQLHPAHDSGKLDSPAIARLIADLELTRWTGRPGYPIRAMVGLALVKAIYTLPTWTRAMALIRDHAGLRDVLGAAPAWMLPIGSRRNSANTATRSPRASPACSPRCTPPARKWAARSPLTARTCPPTGTGSGTSSAAALSGSGSLTRTPPGGIARPFPTAAAEATTATSPRPGLRGHGPAGGLAGRDRPGL
jgi:hypothetical protein